MLCVYPSATIIRTPARLSRGAFPQPSFLSHSSAFAGVGLNIKQALGVLKKSDSQDPSHPLQSLNVHHLKGASLRIAHCFHRKTSSDAITIHKVITLAAAPRAFAVGRGGRWL